MSSGKTSKSAPAAVASAMAWRARRRLPSNEEYQIQIDPIRIIELNAFGAIVDYVYECALSQTP